MDKDIRTGIAPYETIPLRIVELLHLPLHLFPRSCRSWRNEMWALASSYTGGGLQGLKQELKSLKVPRHQFTLRLQAAQGFWQRKGCHSIICNETAAVTASLLWPVCGVQHHLMNG